MNNDTLSIFELNNRKYHIKHNNEQKIVFAIDHHDSYKVNDDIMLNMIYDSKHGFMSKQVPVKCVSIQEKGIKQIAYTFRRRQNYSRKLGHRQQYAYVMLQMGDK